MVCPVKFLSNVIAYNSYWGLWGITYWLRQTGIYSFQTINHEDLPPIEQHIMTVMKLVVIGTVIWIAWRRRRERDIFQPLALAWALFFAFSPGGSPQYDIWPIPILLAAAPARSVYFLVTLSIYQFTCYNWACYQWALHNASAEAVASGAVHGMPWFRAKEPSFDWMFVGHIWADLAWVGYLIWVGLEFRNMGKKETDGGSEAMADATQAPA
jgi:hypothetical protein